MRIKSFWRVLFAGLFLSLPGYAASIHWMGDYDHAHQMALKQHKGLMVILVKPRSSDATKLIRNLQTDPAIVSTIHRQFIPVIVTVDTRTQYPIEMYYTTEFPALFFVDPVQEITWGRCVGTEIISCVQSFSFPRSSVGTYMGDAQPKRMQ